MQPKWAATAQIPSDRALWNRALIADTGVLMAKSSASLSKAGCQFRVRRLGSVSRLIPSTGSNGAPTGTPARSVTGAMPILADAAHNALWVYNGGLWCAVFGQYTASYATTATAGNETMIRCNGSTSWTLTLPSATGFDGMTKTIINSQTNGTITVSGVSGSPTISPGGTHTLTIRAMLGTWYTIAST